MVEMVTATTDAGKKMDIASSFGKPSVEQAMEAPAPATGAPQA